MGRQRVEPVAQVVELGAAADAARRRRGAEAGRGLGGPAAGVDAHHVELGLDRGAGAAVAAGEHRRAGQQAVGEAEAHRQLEVVAGRAHRGGDQRAVEADLEGLLDDHVVGPAPVVGGAAGGESTGEHPLAATPGHARHAIDPDAPTVHGHGRPRAPPRPRPDRVPARRVGGAGRGRVPDDRLVHLHRAPHLRARRQAVRLLPAAHLGARRQSPNCFNL